MRKLDDDQTKLMAIGLSRELAVKRRRQISQLRYELSLDLVTNREQLTGRIRISFELIAVDEPVILDYRDLEEPRKARDQLRLNPPVTDLRVNGQPVADPVRLNGHILIPETYFQSGENEITLGFSSPIASTGRPLIRCTDSEDGTDYIYHLPVPMDASLAYPCFDQPDLKGRFSLTIETPEDWLAVSNSELSETDRLPGRHQFAETPPLSTYLFSFAAGPFALLAGEPEDGEELPLRLYCRRSQAARATEEWPILRSITRQGIDYLTDYLDFRFPFSKYDQVLLPGFPFRGMEHAGATFLREDAILLPPTPTRGDLLNRAALILHELVHQWFGDLVTMRWFDDLWIKEGFANYLAYRTMAAIQPLGLEPRQIWKRFHLMHKPAAYAIDASLGSTPLHQNVPNLRDAKSAYGAIVYQKAPAIIHALCFKLGEEPFRDGVRHFLKRHAFDNADWKDLVNAFEASSGKKLDDWAAAWILERGMPRIKVDCQCSDGKVDQLRIIQQDISGENRCWPVEARLRIVQRDGKIATLDYSLTGEVTEITTLRGTDCPHYILANDDDLAYGRFVLDRQSQQSIIDKIGEPGEIRDGRTDDPFLRTLLWGSVRDALLEGEVAPIDYLNLAQRIIRSETDEDLLQNLLENLTLVFERMLKPAVQQELAPEIEEMMWEGMITAATHEIRTLYFRLFLRLASTEVSRERLKSLLTEETRRPEIDPLQQARSREGLPEARRRESFPEDRCAEDRWKIVATLLALGDPESERLLAAEKLRDQSGDAARQAWMAEAARPDLETKKRYFARYLRQEEDSEGGPEECSEEWPEDWIQGSLANFNSRHQSALTLQFLYPALAALLQLKQERKIFFIIAWLEAFIGGQPAATVRVFVRTFLKVYALPPDLKAKLSFYLPASFRDSGRDSGRASEKQSDRE